MSSPPTRSVDVLIIGAGPVGLITAFQLAKFGGLSIAIIEQHPKSVQDNYGRAITLYPRSSEMLDQLGLAEELAQQCFACRDTVTYNSQGEEVQGRGWAFMETGMKDSAWDFALVLRQKFQEDVLRKALGKFGVRVEAPVGLVSVEVDESLPLLQHRITATVEDGKTGEGSEVKCKFLIGCDGGKSSVRKFMGVPFTGATSADKWVRIDGLVETNLPKPRTYCSIESPTHGNVLWVGLDRGRTRIGYAFTQEREQGYEVFDEAAAVKEAIAAVKPFDLEFKAVDWWTIYSVGQRIAEEFLTKECVFLAGDACHTHSSGAAQGMNTGIHDSVNLAWKLSLVLRGLAKPGILKTYQAERLPNVQKLVQYDKDISRLMTNRLPENWAGDPKADLNSILGDIMAEAASFSSGLGIFYELSNDNALNVGGKLKAVGQSQSIQAGQRAPDVTLLKPGTFERTRLISQTPNHASFYLVMFTGDASHASDFADAVDKSDRLSRLHSSNLLSFLTILPSRASSAYEILSRDPLGRCFFNDDDSSAYSRYGIEVDVGGVVLLRPDGWIGTLAELDANSVQAIEAYFDSVLL